MASSNLEIAIFKNRLARRNSIQINTDFEFLLNINGWRKGKVHVVLGTTSSGKSTLIRSIIWDIIKNNSLPKIACFLSEETCEDYQLELFEGFGSLGFKERVMFFSEQDVETNEQRRIILTNAFQSDCEVLIFDNLTTSAIYGEDYSKQSEFVGRLKNLAVKTNKALILVAHTNNVHRNSRELIDSSHVRGSKTVSNIAEFFFINHQISIDSNMYNFIQIEKHRGQSPESKIFRLDYSDDKRLYTKDRAQRFANFKELWKMRDKL